MSDKIDVQNNVMIIPAFGKALELKMNMTNVRIAEQRLIEAKTVSPITYIELEFCFNEAYRDLKKYMASVGYAITQAEKSVEDAKADVLLGSYAEFMSGKPKSHDSSDLRNAYLTRDPGYSAALDRVAMLKALEANFDGKIKVMERVCAYMKKQIDLVLRSGLSNANLYVTSGRTK